MTKPKNPPREESRDKAEWGKYASLTLAQVTRNLFTGKPSILDSGSPAFIADVTGDGTGTYVTEDVFETKLPQGIWAAEGDIVFTRIWGSMQAGGTGYVGDTELVRVDLILNGVTHGGYELWQTNTNPGVVGFYVEIGIFRGATNDSIGGNLATMLYNVSLDDETPKGCIVKNGPGTFILRDGLDWGGIPQLKLTASARYDANIKLYTAKVIHEPSPISS